MVDNNATVDTAGASRSTNNTGEISTIYYAIELYCENIKMHASETPRQLDLITDSEYCAHLFKDNLPIIQRLRQLLQYVHRQHHHLAISLIKAHISVSNWVCC